MLSAEEDASNPIYSKKQQSSMTTTGEYNAVTTDIEDCRQSSSTEEENNYTTTEDHDANFDTPSITTTTMAATTITTTTTTTTSISDNDSNSRLLHHQQRQQNSSQITLPISDKSGGSSHHEDSQFQQHQSRYHTLMRRPSDDSIRSNFSTTSSVFSTASKISRLPHAVKSSFVSVKDFMKSNRSRAKRLTISHNNNNSQQQQQQQSSNETGSSSPHSSHFSPQTIHYSTPGTSPYSSDRESLASRFRRRTPSTMGLASIFSNNNKDERYSSSTSSGINPSQSTSYSILEVKDPYHHNKTPATTTTRPRQRNIFSNATSSNNNGRRNSVVGAATRFLRRDDNTNNKHNTTNNNPRISSIHEENGSKTTTQPEFGFSDEFEQVIKQEENEQLAEPSSSDRKGVGKLLFGVDLDHMEFFENDSNNNDFRKSATSSTISASYDSESTTVPSSDARSDHITTSKSSTHEVVWSRQRAKSCQVKYFSCLFVCLLILGNGTYLFVKDKKLNICTYMYVYIYM